MSNAKIILRTTSAVLIIIPLFILYGWVVNNDLLKRVIPGLIQMNPNSAVFFIIFGIFLFFHTYTKSKVVQLLRILFCIDIILFCSVIFLRYFSSIDLHIDELLFRSSLQGNRVALATAACFLLSSMILLFIDLRTKSVRIGLQLAILFIFLLASQGIVVDLYNFTGFSQFTIFVPMALSVSICFFILCIATFALREDFEVKLFLHRLIAHLSVKQKIIISLSLSFAILLLIGIISYTNMQHLIKSSDDLAVKIQKIKLRAQLLDELVNAESAQRGYLLTGQGDYLVPYAESVYTYPVTFQHLLRVADHKEDTILLHQIDGYAQLKFKELATTINLRRTQGSFSAGLLVKRNTGKEYMDQIRGINAQLTTLDQQDLDGLLKTNTVATERSSITIILGVLFGLIATVLGISFINEYEKN